MQTTTVEVPAGSVVTLDMLQFRLNQTMGRPVAVHTFRKVRGRPRQEVRLVDAEFVHYTSPPQDTYEVDYRET